LQCSCSAAVPQKRSLQAQLPQVKKTPITRISFCNGKRGISQALPRSLKKMIDLYKTVYTKVSWLEGVFPAGLPIRPLIQSGQAVTVNGRIFPFTVTG
jgi:hypothetical protein